VLKKVDFPLAVFWFRRDLRLEDNTGLYRALKSGLPVLPIFIFDLNILENLKDRKDKRVDFIYSSLTKINEKLKEYGSALWIEVGRPIDVFEKLIKTFHIKRVYTNHDYEPYARERDEKIRKFLLENGIEFITFKDQVIFEKDEILSSSGKPYTIFKHYRNQWRKKLQEKDIKFFHSENHIQNFVKINAEFPPLESIGFYPSGYRFPEKTINREVIKNYHLTRDFPGLEGTTKLGVHLRFGTISIRKLVKEALELNEKFLDELIWREFFMMILWHFPYTVNEPFREEYKNFQWRNDEREFRMWCEGRTGFPIVDAGMRELNSTGYMHNRVRMIVANFLTKILMIDWRWGENYFSQKLVDYEQASNVGNWQWCAGCGVDQAPYFRIFNPELQQKKFDPDMSYIKRWIPEYSENYLKPIVDFDERRKVFMEYAKKILSKGG
jgi:deoxyribodipyrimidine photo-lyase